LLSTTRGLEELPLRDGSLVEHLVLVHLNDRRVAVGVLERPDGDEQGAPCPSGGNWSPNRRRYVHVPTKFSSLS
jgi:hypothetical protein